MLEGDPLYENAERINKVAYCIYDKAIQVQLELFFHSKDVDENMCIFESDGCTKVFEKDWETCMLNFDSLPKCLPGDTVFTEHNDGSERSVYKVDYLVGAAAPYCLYYGLMSKLTSENE